eukprot:Sspe_Gene.2528::Locus_843_Transcript_1_1_Confidence_1.000_Length_1828::g.2528::m.2528
MKRFCTGEVRAKMSPCRPFRSTYSKAVYQSRVYRSLSHMSTSSPLTARAVMSLSASDRRDSSISICSRTFFWNSFEKLGFTPGFAFNMANHVRGETIGRGTRLVEPFLPQHAPLGDKLLHGHPPDDPDGLRDGSAGPGVVPGDHDNVDGGLVARLDSLRNPETGRVLQRQDSREDKPVAAPRLPVLEAGVPLGVRPVEPSEVGLTDVVLPVVGLGRKLQHVAEGALLGLIPVDQLVLVLHRILWNVDVGEAEETETLTGHEGKDFLEGILVLCPGAEHSVLVSVVGCDTVDEAPHTVGTTLHKHAPVDELALLVGHHARRKHPLVLRVERDDTPLDVGVASPHPLDTTLLPLETGLRELEDGLLGGITGGRALLDGEVGELADDFPGAAVQLVLDVPLGR